MIIPLSNAIFDGDLKIIDFYKKEKIQKEISFREFILQEGRSKNFSVEYCLKIEQMNIFQPQL